MPFLLNPYLTRHACSRRLNKLVRWKKLHPLDSRQSRDLGQSSKTHAVPYITCSRRTSNNLHHSFQVSYSTYSSLLNSHPSVPSRQGRVTTHAYGHDVKSQLTRHTTCNLTTTMSDSAQYTLVYEVSKAHQPVEWSPQVTCRRVFSKFSTALIDTTHTNEHTTNTALD